MNPFPKYFVTWSTGLVEGVERLLRGGQGRLCLLEVLLAVALLRGHLLVDLVHLGKEKERVNQWSRMPKLLFIDDN